MGGIGSFVWKTEICDRQKFAIVFLIRGSAIRQNRQKFPEPAPRHGHIAVDIVKHEWTPFNHLSAAIEKEFDIVIT